MYTYSMRWTADAGTSQVSHVVSRFAHAAPDRPLPESGQSDGSRTCAIMPTTFSVSAERGRERVRWVDE
eukprot:967252-Prorocentrum_minimum.AAC.1